MLVIYKSVVATGGFLANMASSYRQICKETQKE
jgi:hypothetical protein